MANLAAARVGTKLTKQAFKLFFGCQEPRGQWDDGECLSCSPKAIIVGSYILYYPGLYNIGFLGQSPRNEVIIGVLFFPLAAALFVSEMLVYNVPSGMHSIAESREETNA